MIASKIRNWMLLFLIMHLIIPSVDFRPFYPFPGLSWFGFDWYPDKGWVVFAQYAFVGIPAFVFAGLPTLLPLILLALLVFKRNELYRKREIACLAIGLLLLAVYLNGWFLYTWPLPYQPVQTFFIASFNLLAYKNWRESLH